MAEYEITAPDGTEFVVTAPDDATESQILEYAKSQFKTQPQRPDTSPRPGESEADTFTRLYGGSPQQRPGVGETAMRGMLQGGTLGLGDELVAAVAAGLDPLKGLVGREPAGGTYGERYDAYLARERAKLSQGREDSPVTAYGSEIAGAIPTTLAGPLNVARGGNYARAIGTGALQGGIYGAGAAEGGLADRLKGAGAGAGLGGTFGAVSVPVATGVGNLARHLTAGRAARDVGLSRPAAEMMLRVSQADEAATGMGAANIGRAGPEAMVVDAGPSAAVVLDAVMQRGGPALTTAGKNIRGRAAGASKEVVATLDDILGNPIGVKTAAKGIAQRTSAGRSEAYDKAYSSVIDYASPEGRAIENVVARVPARILKQAVDNANDFMTSVGQRNQQIMAQVSDDGNVVFSEMPNIQQLDELKKALGNMGRESVDQFGRPTAAGNMLSRLAGELRDAMTEAAPSYGEAVRKGFDKIEMDNALKMGRDLMRPGVTREDIELATRGLSDAAKAEAKIGLRGYIDDVMANVKTAMSDPNVDARETMKALKDFSSRASREKVNTLLGESDANRLYDVIDRAQQTFNVRASLARNSATFARQEANKLLNDLSGAGIVGELRKGEFSVAARNALQKVTGMSPAEVQRIVDNHADELARFLTGPRGNDAISKLKLLAQMPVRAERSGRSARGLAQQLMRPAPAISGGMASQLAQE